jgi:hypothetical protein
MKANNTNKWIGAMFAAVIASCATFANAQTDASAPGAASAAAQAPGASSQRGPSDSTLVRNVRRAFTRTTGLNASNIHVQAHDGVISLTGSVPQELQIERAGSAAKSVSGVRDVSNKLTVRTARGSGP